MIEPRTLGRVWGLLGVAAVAFGAQRGEACSEPDPGPGYYDLGNQEPPDGATDVAIDSAVVIDLNYVRHGRDMSVFVELTHVDTGEVVAGDQPERYWDGAHVAFEPSSGLLPNTAYRVTAKTKSLSERPSDATGLEEQTTTFTTGTELLPPLEIVGELSVELEDYQRDVYESCGGLCSCPPIGTVTDTRAKLSLPGGRGGQDGRGYFVLVSATSDDGWTVNNGSAVVFEDEGTVLELGYLRQDAAYQPCFEVTLRDLAGHQVDGQTLCPGTTLPALDETPSAGSAWHTGAESPESSGCSLVGAGETRSAAVGIGLLALSIAMGARRRGLSR